MLIFVTIKEEISIIDNNNNINNNLSRNKSMRKGYSIKPYSFGRDYKAFIFLYNLFISITAPYVYEIGKN
jgi:hypothetical protein